ncbi:MAG: extracellular solute-binding protein [Saccharospirillaceae bacterium]|nr:extracellular solute-binding protein [Pseudomonadales bacterium]NRB79684.1 extracellular solute-binding protein [Saccharospirillaceae bacterium]
MRKLNFRAKTITLTATIALLAGCNELDGLLDEDKTDDQTDTDLVTTPITNLVGAVADGYIQGAIACLDINENGICNIDEPTSVTDENGGYSFAVTLGDEDKYPILVEVPIGAIDSDYGEVTQAYVLSAPAGYAEFVSPMTTLLQNNMALNPELTATAAEAELIAMMGLTDQDVSLFENYMEQDSEVYSIIHTVAQIVVKEISSNLLLIDNAAVLDADETEKYQLEISVVINNNIINELESIITNVQTAYEQLAEDETLEYADAVSIAQTIDTDIDLDDFIPDLEQFAELLNANVSIDVFGDYAIYFDDSEDSEGFLDDIALEKNLNVSATTNDWGTHHNLLDENLMNNKTSDVILIDGGMVSQYLQSDLFSDLSEEFKSMKDELAPYAVAKGIDATGKQKFIPIDTAPVVAFYRRDYMEDLEFNIDEVMSTWETFYDYGIYLRDNQTVTYYVDKLDEQGNLIFDENNERIQEEETTHVYLVANVGSIFRAMIYGKVENGEGVFTDTNGDYVLNSARIIKAFEYILRLKDADLIAQTGMWNDAWYDGFKEARFAIDIQGNWLLGHIEGWIAPDTTGKWGVSTLPENTLTYAGGTYAAIPVQTENKAEAWKLIEYMINSDNQLNAFKQLSFFPSNTSVYNDDALNQPNEFLKDQKENIILAEISLNINAISDGEYDEVAEQLIINEALYSVLNDDESIEDVLAFAIKSLNCAMGEESVCAKTIEGNFVSSGINQANFPGNIQYKLVVTETLDLIIKVEDLYDAQFMLLDEQFELLDNQQSTQSTFNLTAGVYYIEVTASRLGESGAFTLSVDSKDANDLEAVTLTLHQQLPPASLTLFETIETHWSDYDEEQFYFFIEVSESMQIEFTLNTKTWIFFDVWSEDTDYVFSEYNSNGVGNVTVTAYFEPGTYNVRAITELASEEDITIIISTENNENIAILE